jgi:DNA-binding NarL/FixJ family response regulator
VKRLLSGETNKQIAEGLCLSEDTVKGHLKHIMKRLGVRTRTEVLSMLFQA